MSTRPSVSVVIPVFNGAATLGGCLDAVYASRSVGFEVIVVDDGSTDATREVASRYPCRVLSLPRNVGAAEAKNLGAQAATGDLLFFSDADVHVQPDTLAHVVQDLSDPQVDGVVGLLGATCPYPNFASQFKNLWMHFTYRRQPRRVGLFFTSAAGIRREIFQREGGFDLHYRGASITEDIEFGQRLLSKGYRIVMDQRLTVEHNKHYTLGEVLRTDLLRARGLLQTWVRNRTSASPRAHYASVPWYFAAGVLMMGAFTLCVLLAFISFVAPDPVGGSGLSFIGRHAYGAYLRPSGSLALAAGVSLAAALGFNAPFLLALARWRGTGFMLQSAAFILADLYASGLGIVLGVCDFARGRRY